MANHKVEGWDLDSALSLVREMRPKIMTAGWYLALAGGVLNNGQSTRDLDLVAVPMSHDSRVASFWLAYESFVTITQRAKMKPGGLHMKGLGPEGRKVEVLVVCSPEGGGE